MSDWLWILDDHNGTPIAEPHLGTGRIFTRARSKAAEAVLSLDVEDEICQLLREALRSGLPLLRIEQNGVPRANLRLWNLNTQANGNATTVFTFRDPFSDLEEASNQPGRVTGESREFIATDAGQTAKTLIDETNVIEPTGIDTGGVVEPTVQRDNLYQHKSIGEAITELTKMLDGFDFEITPMPYTAGRIGQLQIYASQGHDNELARFEYGSDTIDNVSSLSEVVQRPINFVRYIGQTSFMEAQHAASIDQFGRWELIESASDVTEDSVLLARAKSRLRPAPVQVVGFTANPASAPVPFEEYNIGDTGRLNVDRGSLSYELKPRLNSIQVVLDDQGNESAHTLTIEAEDATV